MAARSWKEAINAETWTGSPHGILYESWLAPRRRMKLRLPHLFAYLIAQQICAISSSDASETACQCPLPPVVGDGVPSDTVSTCAANNDGKNKWCTWHSVQQNCRHFTLRQTCGTCLLDTLCHVPWFYGTTIPQSVSNVNTTHVEHCRRRNLQRRRL